MYIDVHVNIYRVDYCIIGASLVAQMVKNLPAMQETQALSLSWEDSMEKGNGYLLQFSCLENSMDRGAW